MKIEGNLSKESLYRIARNKYRSYRQRKKESKVYLGILFAMCEGKCPTCGVNMILSFNEIDNMRINSATLDHVYPLSKELEHKKYGLEIMCRNCNLIKGCEEGK